MKDVNSNESNIGEESHSFDRQGSLEVDPTLIGSLDINYGCCHVDAIRLPYLSAAILYAFSFSLDLSISKFPTTLCRTSLQLFLVLILPRPLSKFPITLPSLVHSLTLLRCVLRRSLPRGRSKFSSVKVSLTPSLTEAYEYEGCHAVTLLIPPSIEPNEVDDSMVLPGSNITVGPYTGDSRIKDVQLVKSNACARETQTSSTQDCTTTSWRTASSPLNDHDFSPQDPDLRHPPPKTAPPCLDR
ncbi:hypothetical protein JHK86_043624 [Glycine max]|nr:hypothetical protein JHK86_043624 [Glycine max]